MRDWANVAGNAAIYPELVTRPGAAPAVSPAADAINAMQQALATYLKALGLDPAKKYYIDQRPIPMVDPAGASIHEVLA